MYVTMNLQTSTKVTFIETWRFNPMLFLAVLPSYKCILITDSHIVSRSDETFCCLWVTVQHQSLDLSAGSPNSIFSCVNRSDQCLFVRYIKNTPNEKGNQKITISCITGNDYCSNQARKLLVNKFLLRLYIYKSVQSWVASQQSSYQDTGYEPKAISGCYKHNESAHMASAEFKAQSPSISLRCDAAWYKMALCVFNVVEFIGQLFRHIWDIYISLNMINMWFSVAQTHKYQKSNLKHLLSIM